MKHNIVLIGMMGTGKSTVGKKLSEVFGWQFINMDDLIEVQEGRSITEIFEQSGEAYFRKVEQELLLSLLKQSHKIIATGGGAVLSAQNCIQMEMDSTVIALIASKETIIERVKNDSNRPLLQGNTALRVAEMMELRRGKYDFANFKINTDGRSVDEIVESIEEYLR